MIDTAAPRFLTAAWRNLAILNFAVDPRILNDVVPVGCELDSFAGRTLVSVVGFQFLKTRVLGIPIPFHRDFEEVNLRFYVRRKADGNWRRGVVFIKELVPRRAIAFVARTVYSENYVALAMRHRIDQPEAGGDATLAYEWRRQGIWEGLSMSISGQPVTPGDDTEETFITEHYWGYARQPDRTTVEYQVEHPRWRVWRATAARLVCDAASLYGPALAEPLSRPAVSAFVADGSPVVVRTGRRLT